MKSKMGKAALILAAKGFRVFPVAAGKKAPPLVKWSLAATSDEDKVRAMWGNYPAANIGIATGQGWAVVDLDLHGKRNGILEWKKLVKALELDSMTVFSTTPSGGVHLYYKVKREIKNSASVLAPGIDIRGDGGYVVAPPSVTDQGNYTWGTVSEFKPFPDALWGRLEKDRQPEQRALAPAPALPYSPRRSSRGLERYVEQAVTSELILLGRAQEGQRNDVLNRSAYVLGQLVAAPWAHLDQGAIEAQLLSVAQEIGLSEFEARHTIQSGLTAGMGSPREEPERAYIPLEIDGGDTLSTGKTVVVLETPEAASLLRERNPSWCVLAPTIRGWSQLWTKRIKAAAPEEVLIWVRDRSFGAMVGNEFLKAGLPATLRFEE